MDQIFIGGEVMMGLQRFIRDLTKSWYFRVWILLFAICGLVWFIGLGFLADKSENDYKHLKYEFSVHDYSKKGIRFPDFQFKVPIAVNQKLEPVPANKRCWFVTGITDFTCGNDNGEGKDICFKVFASYLKGFKGRNNRLTCIFNISTEGVIPIEESTNQIGWELLEENSFGLNSNAPIWISPNWEALVLLTKEKWKGEASWGRSLVYESSRPRNKWLYWMITTTIDGWSVREYTDTDPYSGWNLTSDLGGLVAFLGLWFALAMGFVGCVFVNNSSYLHPPANEYDNIN